MTNMSKFLRDKSIKLVGEKTRNLLMIGFSWEELMNDRERTQKEKQAFVAARPLPVDFEKYMLCEKCGIYILKHRLKPHQTQCMRPFVKCTTCMSNLHGNRNCFFEHVACTKCSRVVAAHLTAEDPRVARPNRKCIDCRRIGCTLHLEGCIECGFQCKKKSVSKVPF